MKALVLCFRKDRVKYISTGIIFQGCKRRERQEKNLVLLSKLQHEITRESNKQETEAKSENRKTH